MMSSPKPESPQAVLLLGNYRPAVAIARSLAAAGYRIVLGSRGEAHGCRFSRFVDETWDHPPLDTAPVDLHSALARKLSSDRDIHYVIPVTEEFSQAFAGGALSLPEHVTLASPDAETVKLFSDKTKTLRLAGKLGVPTLPFEVVRDVDALARSVERIGYPLTIRPLGATARLYGKKALILKSPQDLAAELGDWPEGHERLLVQRFATGIRKNLYFAARNGVLVSLCQSAIERTNHQDGTGLAVFGRTEAPSDELAADTLALAAAVEYTGIGLTQFIVDEGSGERCFLELNPRISGSHAVPELAGAHLSRLAIELTDEHAGAADPVYTGRAGMSYAWISGDLEGAKLALSSAQVGALGLVGRLARTLLNALRADVHMIWRLDDPLPAFAALYPVLPRFNRLRRKLAGIAPCAISDDENSQHRSSHRTAVGKRTIG